MREYFYIIIITLGFLAGFLLKYYINKKREFSILQEKLNEYLYSPQNFSGIPEKVKMITLESDTPVSYILNESEDHLILYFKLTDCLTCLYEMKEIIDTFSNFKNLKILLATDHPVISEVQYFIYQLSFPPVIYDRNHFLIKSRVKKTPIYIYIHKNKKIRDIGIIAPLKVEGIETYGLFAHKLKQKLRKK